MSDDSKSVFFVLEILKDGETGFEIGQQLNPVLDQEFGSRILHTFFYVHDPRPGHQACWTCGGDPHSHPSGLTCVCEDGTHQSEVANLRKLATEGIRKFNAQTMQAAKERLGMGDDDQPTPEELEVARKLKQKLDEKAEKRMDKKDHFHIIIDVDHPDEVDAATVYAQLMGSWEVGDIVKKLEQDGIGMCSHWKEGESVWRQEHTVDPQRVHGKGQPGRTERKGEGEKEKTQKVDAGSEQWSAHWLRGYLIDIFKLPATADNWNILEAVRMDAKHWRGAMLEIKQMVRSKSDAPMVIAEDVNHFLQSKTNVLAEIQQLREENARLRGIIEGMEKR